MENTSGARRDIQVMVDDLRCSSEVWDSDMIAEAIRDFGNAYSGWTPEDQGAIGLAMEAGSDGDYTMAANILEAISERLAPRMLAFSPELQEAMPWLGSITRMLGV